MNALCYEIDSLEKLVCLVGKDKHLRGNLYRGVSDYEKHKLIPSLFRYKKTNNFDKLENYFIFQFESKLQLYFDQRSLSKLDIISMAQHHGIPTRLLDWSLSPVVSLFFAVHKEDEETDGAIYIIADEFSPFEWLPHNNENSNDILKKFQCGRQSLIYSPNYYHKRQENQQSIFLICLGEKNLDSYVIENGKNKGKKYIAKYKFPGKSKKRIKSQLFQIGITEAFIYQSLDSLGNEIKYTRQGELEAILNEPVN